MVLIPEVQHQLVQLLTVISMVAPAEIRAHQAVLDLVEVVEVQQYCWLTVHSKL
jgi:hypothetical protein